MTLLPLMVLHSTKIRSTSPHRASLDEQCSFYLPFMVLHSTKNVLLPPPPPDRASFDD